MNLLAVQIPWWKKAWNDKPLQVVLIIALIVRLLAAFFSKGYAFHDDHFDVIRVAQDWIDGLPHWVASSNPPKHSMFYAAINAGFLKVSEFSGITDPQHKMVFVRLIHAFYSLLIVYYGYKITRRYSERSSDAIIVSLMLTLLWFMPYLGVKNLVEMVCIPPLMAAIYYISSDKVTGKDWLIAGLLIGLSFAFRMHVVIFAGGIGLVMLYKKQFGPALIFSSGFLISAFLTIGVIDYIFWEYPFQSIVNYFEYNASNAYNYNTGPFYRFFLTVVGFVVPPVSLFLLVGYVKGWKISREVWLATTLFFIIHSIFPNKQERFIIPFFPFFIILGVIGWNNLIVNSKFWGNNTRLLKGFWWFFWIANGLAVIALALSYSKKDRIEPLTYLEQKTGVRSVLIESSSQSVKYVPTYYLGKNTSNYYDDLFEEYTGKQVIVEQGTYREEGYKIVFQKSANKSIDSLQQEFKHVGKTPNYIIFKRTNKLDERKQAILQLFPGMKLVEEKIIVPSFFDRLLHLLNPVIHKDEVNVIYKVESI